MKACLLLLLALASSFTQGRVLNEITVTMDPNQPVFTSEVTGGGTFWDYDRETAIYIVDEKNEEGSGGNFGVFGGSGSAFAIGFKPDADVTLDLERDGDGNRNRVTVDANAEAVVPLFTRTEAIAGGAEIAINEQPEGTARVAVSAGFASAESQQIGDDSNSFAGFTSTTNAGIGSSSSSQIAQGIAGPNNPQGTTNTQAQTLGVSATASDSQLLQEQLPAALAHVLTAWGN